MIQGGGGEWQCVSTVGVGAKPTWVPAPSALHFQASCFLTRLYKVEITHLSSELLGLDAHFHDFPKAIQ